jgi:transcriptional regulator with XRE-family HTH domain
MADTAIARLARSRARDLRRSIGAELRAAREDRGLSVRRVASEAGVDRSVLARAETGDANLATDALAAVATVLGMVASVRLYPATGPRLHDHIQVRLVETLLRLLHDRWHAMLEVPVYRPSRGVIDLVLADREAGEIVSGEAHSEIRSAERQLRWAAEKSNALPSADGWPWMRGHPRTGRLLLLRSTAATRAVARDAPAVLATAYPGSTREAFGALTTGVGAFPGAAIMWVDVRGTASRLLDGPPRGIAVGR